jgi:hypothetical protein
MKKNLFLLLLLTMPLTYAGILEDYRSVISEKCSSPNPLLIKKSLIELNQNMQNCEGAFTQKILQNCQEINCEYLTVNYNKLSNTKSGSVIGR